MRVTGTTVSVQVSCSDSGSCNVKLVLTVVETLEHGKLTAITASAKQTAKKTIVVGSGSVTITAGGSQRIQLTLNATGKRLLSKHNPLKAKLSVSHAGRTITSTTVKFSSKPAKGR